MTLKPCRLAVLLSGTGTTMVNLQDHIERGDLPAEIVVVVSSRKNVLGLERAADRGIETRILTRKAFRKDGKFDVNCYSKAMAETIAPFSPDLVVMAGFMTRLGPPLLDKYNVMNVHPALLPKFGGDGFYGHHVHEAVLKSGDKVTGATVHFADSEYDRGPIIIQESIPVLETDTPDTLADRVQALERKLYPKAVSLYADGKIKRNGRKVEVIE